MFETIVASKKLYKVSIDVIHLKLMKLQAENQQATKIRAQSIIKEVKKTSIRYYIFNIYYIYLKLSEQSRLASNTTTYQLAILRLKRLKK